MVLSALSSLSSQELTLFFLAIGLLLLSAHLLGYIFQRLSLPKVIGEIVGGLLLGPTVLGWLSPSLENGLFGPSSEGRALNRSLLARTGHADVHFWL